MMDTEQTIFTFELDFAGTLRCIPMVVRFKLDLAGIKLTLRQWSRFERDERQELVLRPCGAEAEVGAYRRHVMDLIALRADEPPVDMPVDPHPAWAATHCVPERLVRHARNLDLTPPTLEQWKAITPLQRFTLFKLTRPGHDNDNFEPAMNEFGFGVH
jgi:hypothetical protein